MKDIVGVVVFLFFFSAVVFFMPEGGGYFLEFNNFILADPLKTPPHIAPVWYFTPFYSMLRATTDPMVNVLCVVVGLAGVAGLVGMKGMTRFAMFGAAVVGIVLLKTFDAKVWGVIVVGGAIEGAFAHYVGRRYHVLASDCLD